MKLPALERMRAEGGLYILSIVVSWEFRNSSAGVVGKLRASPILNSESSRWTVLSRVSPMWVTTVAIPFMPTSVKVRFGEPGPISGVSVGRFPLLSSSALLNFCRICISLATTMYNVHSETNTVPTMGAHWPGNSQYSLTLSSLRQRTDTSYRFRLKIDLFTKEIELPEDKNSQHCCCKQGNLNVILISSNLVVDHIHLLKSGTVCACNGKV